MWLLCFWGFSVCVCLVFWYVFFFKQKTAYEMRISDWSSDVCSSDLPLMPKATAVWLVDNTTLTFRQIAEFCGLHELEIKAIADQEEIGRASCRERVCQYV